MSYNDSFNVFFTATSTNMSLNIAFKETIDCVRNLIVQNCSLRAATVGYHIVIDTIPTTDTTQVTNAMVSLGSSYTICNDTLDEITTAGDGDISPGTYGRQWLVLSNKFNSEANVRFGGAITSNSIQREQRRVSPLSAGKNLRKSPIAVYPIWSQG